MAGSEIHNSSRARVVAAWYAAVRARRWLIIIVTGIVAALATVREVTSSSPVYSAETQIEVTSVALSTDARYVSAIGDLRYAIPRTYPPKIYERLLQSPAVVDQVIERLVDEGHFDKDSAPDVDEFSEKVKLYVDVLDQTTRPVTYSPIIRLLAKAETPELCEAMLRAWTDVVIEVANDRLAANVKAKSETLAAECVQLESNLRDLREQLRLETATWNLEVIRKEIELIQQRQDLLIQAHQSAQQESDAAIRQLVVVEAQLDTEKPFREYRKAPSDDAYFLSKDNNGKDSGGSGDSVAGDVMVTQEENVVYTELKKKENEFRINEAAATAKLKTLDAQIEVAKQAVEARAAALSDHDISQKRLNADIAIAQAVYADIAKESSFSDIALSLTSVSGESGERAVGLNRVSDRIIPTENNGTLASIITVMVATLTAFALITAFVLFQGVLLPALQGVTHEQSKA